MHVLSVHSHVLCVNCANMSNRNIAHVFRNLSFNYSPLGKEHMLFDW